MKLGKYILGLALIAAGLTSCDQDNIGAIYEPTMENISFIQPEQSTITKQSSIEVPVAIGRANTNGNYTATITISDASEGVSLKSNQITFVDGEGLANAIVVVNNMEPGVTYSCNLSLSAADQATQDKTIVTGLTTDEEGNSTKLTENQISITSVSVFCDYNWLDAGTCHFVDYNWEDGWEADVPVINAERTNIYRIVDPLGIIYADTDGANGTYFEFTLNADGSITVPEGYWNLNYWGYRCYYDSDPAGYGAYCYIEQDGNTYGVNHLLVYGSNLYIGYFEFTYSK